MKFFDQIIATVFAVAILFSCNQKKNSDKIIAATPQIKKEIEVRYIGEVRTRRSFIEIQSIDNEKEKERYIEEQEKSNPFVDDIFTATDSLVVACFEKINLIKNNQFLEGSFKPDTKEATTFVDSAKKEFPLRFFYDSLTGHTHFKIFFSNDSADTDTKAFAPQVLNYAFIDVIPGANKELVFLDEYYFMNGYNFDYKVYEIKTN
ncbi:hypothetical protein [Ferruginibacter profundus]